LRAPFAQDLACLRAGQAWLLQTDVLLRVPTEQQAGTQSTDAQQAGTQSTDAQQAFAAWRDGVARSARRLPPPYADGLAQFVGVLTRMQPHLFAWTRQAGLPRTNNDLQRFIRAMKTR
jgi:hypothetical protein